MIRARYFSQSFVGLSQLQSTPSPRSFTGLPAARLSAAWLVDARVMYSLLSRSCIRTRAPVDIRAHGQLARPACSASKPIFSALLTSLVDFIQMRALHFSKGNYAANLYFRQPKQRRERERWRMRRKRVCKGAMQCAGSWRVNRRGVLLLLLVCLPHTNSSEVR